MLIKIGGRKKEEERGREREREKEKEKEKEKERERVGDSKNVMRQLAIVRKITNTDDLPERIEAARWLRRQSR